MIAGCASAVPLTPPGPDLPAAPLPSFAPGDAFTFNDGRIDRVVAVDAERVRWRDTDSADFTTSRDVLLPRLAWSGASLPGAGQSGAGEPSGGHATPAQATPAQATPAQATPAQATPAQAPPVQAPPVQARSEQVGTRRLSGPPASLWPLRVGNRSRFTAVREVAGGAVRIDENWDCRVAGTATLTTRAGRFDTFRVSCDITVAAPPGAAGVADDELGQFVRTFFYAPQVGYFVRREDHMPDGDEQVIELTDYVTAPPALPATAQRARGTAVQQALEKRVSGEAVDWTNTGYAGEVRPLRTWRNPALGWCREYEERIDAPDRRFRLLGAACRDGAGRWDRLASDA